MKHTLLLAPIGLGVGLTTVAMGLIRSIENQGLTVYFLDPISHSQQPENTEFHEETIFSSVGQPLNIHFVEHLLGKGREDTVLEHIIAQHQTLSKDADIVVLKGFISTQLRTYAPGLNHEIAKALNAEIIFLTSPGNQSPSFILDQIEISSQIYGGLSNPRILGCMINKIGAPVDKFGNTRIDLFDPIENTNTQADTFIDFFKDKKIKILACFPWDRAIMAPRVKDVAKFLKAELISEGKMLENRVMHFVVGAASVENFAPVLKPDVMVITPRDRSETILATCMASLNGVKIAALLLSGTYPIPKNTMELCRQAIHQGLPILSVQTDSLRTAVSLQNINAVIPEDDFERIEEVKERLSQFIDKAWIHKLASTYPQKSMSPPAFRYKLIEMARKAHKKIVLPEGEEPRIIKAANICTNRHIAHCVLLGNPDTIHQIAKDHGIELNQNIEIINPKSVRKKYIDPLVELRKHKGIDHPAAKDYLENSIVLGTMMLACSEVDGLVAGSKHTTAMTVRPALKLIKTGPDTRIVSSLFFMCLPTEVLIYADCAVNQNPSAEDLADIAIQSADSAKKFDIEPTIAMISYSTGTSGTGQDVEKVQKATELVKKLRPDLLVDGPLQYDAAYSVDVAGKKAPESFVAGKATLYVFPDLNTANTTYKAVQRSANVLSVGPMLQGLNKPVNDLSRGATIEDIVYTIAITAIQASEN